MKKFIHILITIFILLSISSCTAPKDSVLKQLNKNHATTVRKDIEIFSSGNIAEITECIFGIRSEEASADHSDNGIIADLFANAEVQITSADESTISYTIVSPDISDFFTVCVDQLDSITTSEELGQAILEYAKTAPTKEYNVTISYSVNGDDIDVNYDNSDFINAMTGGLLEAYADLYSQHLDEMG